MLKFLKNIKNIFARKEAPEEKISLDELDAWLGIKAKPIFNELNARINEIIEKINSEKNTASENIKALESAQLQNQKIPERAKIIMEGNREGFIKKVSLFFDKIDFKGANSNADINLKHSNYDELIKKCQNIENEINSLGSSTARNYHILNEFFAREAEKVAANIKNVEGCCKEITGAVSGSKISNISKIKGSIISLKNKIKLRESYLISLERNKNALQDSNNKKIEAEKKINAIKSGSDYKNYEKLLEEKEKTEIKIKEIENILFHDFSVLEKALKKYAKVAFEDEKQILGYLENPIIALAMDDDFKILKILDNLKISIEQNKLELEEKKKGKPIEKICGLGSAYLTKIKDDFISAKKMLDDLAAEIKNISSKKNLDLLNEELKNIDENIEKANSEISILSKELEKIDIEKLREELQKEISSAVNIKITVL